MDSELADLAEVILAIARELRMGMDAETVHLTPSEAFVMRYIDNHPGAAPSDVAKYTGLQRSNLSTALRSLERRGFVQRLADPHDARGANLFPTDLAAANLTRLRRQWARQMATALGDDAGDVATVKNLLRTVESAMLTDRLG
ncbi:MarR family transcriptional regulator [Mycobacterium sp. M26]|uniref:MarR family winged helix-turn-helix transcriptional regulator n=1 Tax=Mycobacterium sp. M26 TaxID=1762962 RepID=UPI00073EAC0E|nr:MarR family transcriptional regulator [Mycobacterium sp. M26]